jgi:broad specificity phosphatase PhoE
VIVIVRHGRTAANAAGRLLGRLDVPLDELGREQAVLLAAAVGPVDRVVTSPLQRARQTAGAFDAPIEVDERWIELDYGDFDGTPIGDVPTEVWRTWRSDIDYRPPGGESLATMAARVRAALDELQHGGGDETVVVVSHVSPIKAAVAWALGVPDDVTWRMFVSPASITRLDVTPGGRSLRTFNEIAHL